MARRPAATETRRSFMDSFVNFAANLGYGAQNLASGARYDLSPVSRNRVQLEMMYRSSWMVRQVVDAPAEDMTRAGIMLETDMEPDDEGDMMEDWGVMQLWQALQEALKWSRLYGGAICAIMIDGQNPEEPLRLDRIGPNQFKGLMVMDRWMLSPQLGDTIRKLGPEFGLPIFYDVVSDAHSVPGMRIHHTRVIRFEGADLPYWQKMAENGWGLSVIEPMWDRMIAFDSATSGAAQLVYKAHLRTLSVDGLRQLIAGGGTAYRAFLEQVGMIRLLQSNEGLTILDATDKFETHQYAFAGLSDVLQQFGQQLSGAAQIPLVRLFGQSPAGLNSTGDSDIRNYYDMINAKQEAHLRHPIRMLLEILHRSKFGRPLPDGFNFSFRPLWQLAENEKAQSANQLTQTILSAFEQSVIGQRTVLKELREQSKVTGVFSNITDEDIDNADPDPPQPEMGGMGMGGDPSALPGQNPGPDMPEPGGAGEQAAKLAREPAGVGTPGAPTAPTDGLPRGRVRPLRGALGELAAEVRQRRRARDTAQGGVPDLVRRVSRLKHRADRVDRIRSVLHLDQQPPMVEINGIKCIVEADKGQARFPQSPPLPCRYGYIQGTGSTEGSAEQMDCYIGDDPDARSAYIIHQHHPGGDFDEHKCMLGFSSQDAAKNAYLSAWPDGAERLGKIYSISIPQLKRWLRVWQYVLPNVKPNGYAARGA